MLGRWNRLIHGKTDSGLNEAWLALNTKMCPKCKIVIEKNKGCMHIHCVNCKYHFCWLCLEEYVNHTDYYSCNKYKEVTCDKLSLDEMKSKKYNFFSDRFRDHLAAVNLTKRESTKRISKLKFILTSSLHIEDKFIGFYINAYEALIGKTIYSFPCSSS